MAIRRLKPIQDTFIVKSATLDQASFGGDEILELGVCPNRPTEGCSRILLEFMTNEAEELLGENSLIKATLNLKYAYAENLPSVYGIDVTEIRQEWTEGDGHVNDLPGCTKGASWFKPKGASQPDMWEGGLEQGEEYEFKHDYFTSYQESRDISIDVTEWVYQWFLCPCHHRGLGFLLKCSNEELMEERNARLCFYSSETHTTYAPYLELVFDDSVRDIQENTEEADVNNLYISTRNLKEHYYFGDKARIDLLVRPLYPKRVFTTASLYRNDSNLVLPSESFWAIRDEYTGEIHVPFNDWGTKISYDEKGNYMLLDTTLLKPERYYRLLFEVNGEDGSRKVFDSKNIFRITKYGEI